MFSSENNAIIGSYRGKPSPNISRSKMSMQTSVKGYRSPEDPEHQKHLKVLRVCREVGVSLPEETAEYFGPYKPEYIDPDCTLEIEVPFRQVYPTEGVQGYEVIVSDIPMGVHKIRFENSY